VRVSLATDSVTVRGVELESPIVTRVAVVSEETVCPLRAQLRSVCGPADDVETLPEIGEIDVVEARA
jgi:hypothetical protein